MPAPRRIQRLESLILHTLAPLVAQGLQDPRLHLVTVTRVSLTHDLSLARAFWTCLGGEADRSRARHALEHARGHLQGELAHALQTRTVPTLRFQYDEELEKALRVERVLEDLAKEREMKEEKSEEE